MAFSRIILIAVYVLSSVMLSLAANSLFPTRFHRDINLYPMENVNRTEVDGFYNRFGESPVSRCRFMDVMVGMYGFDSLKTSALFDLMQSADGSNLSRDEFVASMMGDLSTQAIGNTTFIQTLDALAANVDLLIARPHELNTGLNRYERTAFLVEQLANTFDANEDGAISTSEISAGMRRLDLNGDWGIQRCEFVQSMQTYRQHAATSAKVYDIIFMSRDLAWADVDSLFLANMMDRNRNRSVSRSEFIRFFNLENDLASGVPVEPNSLLVSSDNGQTALYANLVLAIAAVLLALINAL